MIALCEFCLVYPLVLGHDDKALDMLLYLQTCDFGLPFGNNLHYMRLYTEDGSDCWNGIWLTIPRDVDDKEWKASIPALKAILCAYEDGIMKGSCHVKG